MIRKKPTGILDQLHMINWIEIGIESVMSCLAISIILNGVRREGFENADAAFSVD